MLPEINPPKLIIAFRIELRLDISAPDAVAPGSQRGFRKFGQCGKW